MLVLSALGFINPSLGADAPESGRSLFDELFTVAVDGRPAYAIPFPFEALTLYIAQQVPRTDGVDPLAAVLVPMGRSLQRDAARPDYFKYPRAVVAVHAAANDPNAPPGPLLKDRLYLGYQEKAMVLEVISYNRTAGRFEFQVVSNYGAGRPEVRYARRELCLGCHQNAAPIWSRPPWDEANAIEQTARRIAGARNLSTRDRLYGIPVLSRPDAPLLISESVEAANRLRLAQEVWQKLCADPPRQSNSCRMRLLMSALRHRLTTLDYLGDSEELQRLDAHIKRQWSQIWPAGLTSGEPLVPNRLPDPNAPRVSAGEDPLNPRPDRDPLTVKTPGLTEKVIDLIAAFLRPADVDRLDEVLAGRGPVRPSTSLELRCAIEGRNMGGWVDRIRFQCPSSANNDNSLTGRFFVRDGQVVGGYVDRVERAGSLILQGLIVSEGAIERKQNGVAATLTLRHKASGHRPRLPDGNRVGRLQLRWLGEQNRAFAGFALPDPSHPHAKLSLPVFQDFGQLRDAVDRVFRRSERPLSGPKLDGGLVLSAVLDELQPGHARLAGQPGPSVLRPITPKPPAALRGGRFALLHRYCGSCHDTPDRFPPNFLHGDEATIESALRRCASRAYVRVKMAAVAHAQRTKSPMPPIPALSMTLDTWRQSTAFSALSRLIGNFVRAGGESPRQLLHRPYESLAACISP